MKFRTSISPLKHQGLVSHQTKLISLGSCFAVNIGEQLKTSGFSVTINPFGILFNPLSLLKVLKGKSLVDDHLLTRDNSVMSYDFHSKFKASTNQDFKIKYQDTMMGVQKALKNNDILMLTFGTAWTYQLKSTGQVIAICQKQDSQLFTKEILDLEALKVAYSATFKAIFANNKDLSIVLTVSPVRHLKDGVIENNQSKAMLLLLCQHLAGTFPGQVIYYPSYELVMDDLRDYRFYKSDLIHPNEMAVDYIYEHFMASFCTAETISNTKYFNQYAKLKQHQLMSDSSSAHQTYYDKINALEQKIKTIRQVD